MQKRVKGAAIAPLILIGAGIAIGVVGTIAVGSLLNHGGGLGDGKSLEILEADAPEQTAPAVTEISTELLTEPPTEEITTEPETEPVTFAVSDMQVIAITVSGNDYFLDEKSYTLEEIIGSLKSMETDEPVQIIDHHASLKAYRNLTAQLLEQKISYYEEGTN